MMVAEPYRGGRLCEVYYRLGTAWEFLGDATRAREAYESAVMRKLHFGLSESHFYRALALEELGRYEEAQEIFDGLVALGKRRLESQELDFFAKFGEQQTPDDMKADAYYLLGLGYIGKEMNEDAARELEAAVRLNSNHVWAAAMLDQLNK
jgi:tetratricopeptide (TPR) repeat protein